MASKGMWEVDPETRSKLAQIAKTNDNFKCIDCDASSPQWASPKFGIFVCLECAGKHRGLSVQVSFIRSVSMDSFKAGEIERMRLGGNRRWREFWENHEYNKDLGLTWDGCTIKERYDSPVGEEYKERLAAEVEGREYVQPAPGNKPPPQQFSQPQRATTTSSMGNSRSGSPAQISGGPALSGKAKVDDKYFSRLGNANAARPADLPPSQGGKYGGFGSEMPSPPGRSNTGGGPPGVDDFQKDPVAALTKGFGWFGGMVGKVSKQVNEGYIAPAAQRLAEADLSTQARLTAAQLAKSAQSAAAVAAKTAQTGGSDFRTTFNRFVEGQDDRKPLDETKTDFWESFGKPAEERGLGSRAMGASGNGSGKMTGMAGGMAVERNEWSAESNLKTERSDEGGFIGGNIPSVSTTKTTAVKEKKPTEAAKVEEGDWEKW